MNRNNENNKKGIMRMIKEIWWKEPLGMMEGTVGNLVEGTVRMQLLRNNSENN